MSKRPHCTHPFATGKRSTCTIPYPVCCRCGLIVLRNDVSQRALRAPCPGRDD